MALVESALGLTVGCIGAALASIPFIALIVFILWPDDWYDSVIGQHGAGLISSFALEQAFSVFWPVLLLLLVLTAWGRFTLARVYLAATNRLPFRLINFLQAGHSAGLLRQTGPAYQFRHLRLQDRLAERYTRTRTKQVGSSTKRHP